jgi:hypothetical protein
MKLEILRTADDVHKIGSEWNNLLWNSENNKLHFSHEWFLCSYNVFHSGDQLYVIVLRDDSSILRGIAPLVIVRETYRFKRINKICFPRNNQNPSNDFVFIKGYELECIGIIMDHLCNFSEWNMVDLHMIDASQSTSLSVQQFINKENIPFGIKPNRTSPYIEIDIGWDDFWKLRSVKFRKSLRNKINKAKKRGYTVEKRSFSEIDPNALADMLAISCKSWKRSIGTDLLTQKENWSFYNKICACFSSSGNVSLYFLNIDNVPVAFEFHLEDQSVVYPIRADYDDNFEQISPGSILEYEIIHLLYEKGDVKEYNSCGHTYQYLMNWTNQARQYINYEIFDKSVPMKSLHLFEYTLLPYARKYHVLYNFIKRTLFCKEDEK